MVYTPGSQSRNWSAFVEPITTRRQIFHLVKSEPQKVVNGKIEPPVDYEVELVFHKLERDGDWGPAPPTMTSSFESRDLENFMQCIVDEAAKLGIVAKNCSDHAAEMKRVEYHLEDMRKLVFKS